jgi:hypothetical protein
MIEERLEHEKFTDRCRAASKSGKSEGEIHENFPFPALAKTVRSKGHRYWTPVPTTFQPALCPIQRPNRWLDGLIAHALATTLQTYILVFERHQGACGRPRAGRPRRASGAHYVWVGELCVCLVACCACFMACQCFSTLFQSQLTASRI